MTDYLPEGSRIETSANKNALQSAAALQEAYRSGTILEARATVCSAEHDLIFDLGGVRGVIPRTEGALGIENGKTRDIAIISRVNKPVCFRIIGFSHDQSGRLTALCSRRAVQEECTARYLNTLRPGDVIPAVVTHLETFGCFADIGCGISSLLPIDNISVSRIHHPSDRFHPGQTIRVIVSGRDSAGRLSLTHKELLGTWEENAAEFEPGETVAGIIRSVEEYGVFVELTPNLAGLAEPSPDLHPGQQASVYIKSLIPEKMKIKLILVDAFDGEIVPPPLHYYFEENHLDAWQYSPASCPKQIATQFSREGSALSLP